MTPNHAAVLYILAADGPTASGDLVYALHVGERRVRYLLAELIAVDLVGWHQAPQDGVGIAPRLYHATPAGHAFAAREQVAA